MVDISGLEHQCIILHNDLKDDNIALSKTSSRISSC